MEERTCPICAGAGKIKLPTKLIIEEQIGWRYSRLVLDQARCGVCDGKGRQMFRAAPEPA